MKLILSVFVLAVVLSMVFATPSMHAEEDDEHDESKYVHYFTLPP